LEKYQITSALIGILIGGSIIWLVRRDHLHGRFAIWWLLTGIICALMGIFPQAIDWVALRLGIAYPPILALVLGVGFLVLKIITMDIERSKNEIKLQRLVQRLAILEGALLEQGKDLPD
jgi:hypothetical protein